MILRHYIEKEGIRKSELARVMGVSRSSIHRCMGGENRVGPKFALKIEAITNGVVSRSEAIYPEDYIDIDENGKEQLRLSPKIHHELAEGIKLVGKLADKPIQDKEFYNWAYGVSESQTAFGHCTRWAEMHPELKRVDTMTIEDGLSYMRAEYKKYLRGLEK